ncbi:MAG TPA: alkaline phosphatase, partial [Parvularculaceae bacterium]|nr:alkaline phosphatase [Parvularculaceae bacterium]
MILRRRLLLAVALPFVALPACAQTAAKDAPSVDPYFADGQATLAARRAIKPITKRAKNVILFIADGMDPTTVAAARIYDGQSRGEEGE